ncbi:MAG TPA: 23S rRNA (guanine(2445)-N(2))/(guanine(2069)-N(7))-methyltransferase, partial [Gammaproteobacteria bacterium]|nr:23S rRNA (guanine(2445)-N(2))/(guanine(2069)-N(7))-methyltransferase [Gammaproteobacteria bacterium]
MANQIFNFFASTAKGLEDLLAQEIQNLGIESFKQAKAGVYFTGTQENALSLCLWSRIANRVLLQISQFEAESEQRLYSQVQQIAWQQYIQPQQTLSIDCSVSHSQINHNKYAALKTKDAIVDQLRDQTGSRPDINTEQPDVRLNLYIYRDKASLSLDLSGDSLHKRGYRIEGEHAPLKENLAAGILMRCQWLKRSINEEAFVDPMCGSGTLLIEAAMMAADIAPGLKRKHWGFYAWQYFDNELWQSLLHRAEQRKKTGLQALPSITGYDASKYAIRAAEVNIRAV